MNLKVIVAIVLLAVAAGVGVSSFKRTMTPYIGFAEARTASGLVQVNGKLADKNYVLKPEEQFLGFHNGRRNVVPLGISAAGAGPRLVSSLRAY